LEVSNAPKRPSNPTRARQWLNQPTVHLGREANQASRCSFLGEGLTPAYSAVHSRCTDSRSTRLAICKDRLPGAHTTTQVAGYPAHPCSVLLSCPWRCPATRRLHHTAPSPPDGHPATSSAKSHLSLHCQCLHPPKMYIVRSKYMVTVH